MPHRSVSILKWNEDKPILDTFVKPDGQITDYNGYKETDLNGGKHEMQLALVAHPQPSLYALTFCRRVF